MYQIQVSPIVRKDLLGLTFNLLANDQDHALSLVHQAMDAIGYQPVEYTTETQLTPEDWQGFHALPLPFFDPDRTVR